MVSSEARRSDDIADARSEPKVSPPDLGPKGHWIPDPLGLHEKRWVRYADDAPTAHIWNDGVYGKDDPHRPEGRPVTSSAGAPVTTARWTTGQTISALAMAVSAVLLVWSVLNIPIWFGETNLWTECQGPRLSYDEQWICDVFYEDAVKGIALALGAAVMLVVSGIGFKKSAAT